MVLIAGLALIGLRRGWIVATMTETDVINAYAQRYLRTGGPDAALSDCVALSGAAYPGVWLIVRCVPETGEGAVDYYVNRRGGLVRNAAPPQDAPTVPRT